ANDSEPCRVDAGARHPAGGLCSARGRLAGDQDRDVLRGEAAAVRGIHGVEGERRPSAIAVRSIELDDGSALGQASAELSELRNAVAHASSTDDLAEPGAGPGMMVA